MGFGFVVARFGLFLQQVFQPTAPASSPGMSLWLGTALIAVGVVVNLSSAWHHARSVWTSDKGEPRVAVRWPQTWRWRCWWRSSDSRWRSIWYPSAARQRGGPPMLRSNP